MDSVPWHYAATILVISATSTAAVRKVTQNRVVASVEGMEAVEDFAVTRTLVDRHGMVYRLDLLEVPPVMPPSLLTLTMTPQLAQGAAATICVASTDQELAGFAEFCKLVKAPLNGALLWEGDPESEAAASLSKTMNLRIVDVANDVKLLEAVCDSLELHGTCVQIGTAPLAPDM